MNILSKKKFFTHKIQSITNTICSRNKINRSNPLDPLANTYSNTISVDCQKKGLNKINLKNRKGNNKVAAIQNVDQGSLAQCNEFTASNKTSKEKKQ